MSQLSDQSPLMNDRSREIFRRIVESYLNTGEPVGSRSLSRELPMTLSPASVRNVMSDLEELGLVYAPHTSAGRLPTQLGLRMFVDGLLEVGSLSDEEQRQIEAQIAGDERHSTDQLLTDASEVISGLSECAGVVLADKQVSTIKHIEFVPLEPGKALVVLVGDNASVENRIISVPKGLPPSAMTQAGNYLNAHIQGMSLDEARRRG
jgi:heat-inducible transcriptional repressor